MSRDDQLMDGHEAGGYLHRPEATLRNWRYQKVGPPYVRVGRKVLYRRSDLDAWLDRNTVEPQGAA